MNYKTELDALLDRLREDKADTAGKNRNVVAYDCWRMFEDLAKRLKEESAMRDRYKRQSNSWRDKALELGEALAWKPIETAPRDGAMILIAHNHWGTINVTLAAYGRVNYGCGQFEDGWRSYSGFLTGAKWWCAIPSVESLSVRSHRWGGCQTDPINHPGEYVRYCLDCGQEDTCEDPLPPCEWREE